jgi:predicted DNA-binding transcriptional regulator AlpA
MLVLLAALIERADGRAVLAQTTGDPTMKQVRMQVEVTVDVDAMAAVMVQSLRQVLDGGADQLGRLVREAVKNGQATQVGPTTLAQVKANRQELPGVQETPEHPSLLVDVKEVARLIGASPRHVYRLSDMGRMPTLVRIGQCVRWNVREIKDWVAAGCPPCRRRSRQDRNP